MLQDYGLALYTNGKDLSQLNSIALRQAKIAYNFGLSECNRVKHLHSLISV